MAAVTWKDKLKGSFDLLFLFGRGIEPFEKDNNRRAGLQSLWIVAVMFPLGLLVSYLWPQAGMEKEPMSHVLLANIGEGLIGLVTGIGLSWVSAKAFNRMDRFWVIFQAFNWVGIPLSLVSLPFLILALMHWYPREVMDNIFMFILYYGFIVSGCIFYRGLKISWEFAGFLACMAIAIGQLTQNLVFWLAGVPIR
jgi:hypothetical protein